MYSQRIRKSVRTYYYGKTRMTRSTIVRIVVMGSVMEVIVTDPITAMGVAHTVLPTSPNLNLCSMKIAHRATYLE